MSEYIKNVKEQPSGLDWAVAFNRKSATPLDRSSLFSSYADALAYAKGDGSDERGLGTTSYVGQIIAVLESGSEDKVSVYIIGPNRELIELLQDIESFIIDGGTAEDVVNLPLV